MQKSRSKSHRLGKNCEAFVVPQKKTYTKNFYRVSIFVLSSSMDVLHSKNEYEN